MKKYLNTLTDFKKLLDKTEKGNTTGRRGQGHTRSGDKMNTNNTQNTMD